jgi:hypothetical protein
MTTGQPLDQTDDRSMEAGPNGVDSFRQPRLQGGRDP